MKSLRIISAVSIFISVTACMGTNTNSPETASDACGASQYQNLVGGPSIATIDLKIPGSSRHYGINERVATNDPSRLNFVHSGTAIESVIDPKSTVIKVFCG